MTGQSTWQFGMLSLWDNHDQSLSLVNETLTRKFRDLMECRLAGIKYPNVSITSVFQKLYTKLNSILQNV